MLFFVAFLYFYYLSRGNLTTSNICENMVVVIDDPVPSLDSGVLFIVTTLICDLFLNEHEFTHIKQFFILTHNIYFYKSVSQGKRGNPLPDATYYLVKKHDNETYIEYHKKNPIKGSYELLWQEIKGPQRNNSTIQNTMRCIFEN